MGRRRRRAAARSGARTGGARCTAVITTTAVAAAAAARRRDSRAARFARRAASTVSRIATRRTHASGRSYLATRGHRVSARANASWGEVLGLALVAGHRGDERDHPAVAAFIELREVVVGNGHVTYTPGGGPAASPVR